MTSYELAQQAIKRGFHPIPLNDNLHYYKKGSKNNTLEQDLEIFKNDPNCNIGIKTGRDSSITCLDIDVQDFGIEVWNKILQVKQAEIIDLYYEDEEKKNRCRY